MIVLNGLSTDLKPGDTLVLALERLGLAHDTPGVAIAVDGEVVPRGGWQNHALGPDSHVEVLSAMQGG